MLIDLLELQLKLQLHNELKACVDLLEFQLKVRLHNRKLTLIYWSLN